jgi:hypothetical protein
MSEGTRARAPSATARRLPLVFLHDNKVCFTAISKQRTSSEGGPHRGREPRHSSPDWPMIRAGDIVDYQRIQALVNDQVRRHARANVRPDTTSMVVPLQPLFDREPLHPSVIQEAPQWFANCNFESVTYKEETKELLFTWAPAARPPPAPAAAAAETPSLPIRVPAPPLHASGSLHVSLRPPPVVAPAASAAETPSLPIRAPVLVAAGTPSLLIRAPAPGAARTPLPTIQLSIRAPAPAAGTPLRPIQPPVPLLHASGSLRVSLRPAQAPPPVVATPARMCDFPDCRALAEHHNARGRQFYFCEEHRCRSCTGVHMRHNAERKRKRAPSISETVEYEQPDKRARTE